MDLEEKVKGIYDNIMEKPNKIFEIFKDYFGESYVDMQGFPDIDKVLRIINFSIQSVYSWESLLGLYKDTGVSIKESVVESLKVFWKEDRPIKELLDYIPDDGDLILKRTIIGLHSSDFNNIYILIYYPEVRVTNEFDKSIDIQGLYVKVSFNYRGNSRGYFTMNRSKYSIDQFRSGYLHSHISSIPTSDFTHFQSPCLGAGPINRTLGTLITSYDEPMWQLLCLEIDRFVRTESVSGIPYVRLESVSSGNPYGLIHLDLIKYVGSPLHCNRFNSEYYRSFIEYLFKSGKLKFNFFNGSYGIGMTEAELFITISNEFINWYNNIGGEIVGFSYRELIFNKILIEATYSNGNLYENSSSMGPQSIEDYQGKYVCEFKGKEVKLSITSTLSEDCNKVILLNSGITTCIVGAILEIINYKYGNYKAKQFEGRDCEKTVYL